ncbi:MAG: glycosyltransferase [Candidatus Hadarchaeum sp.]
MRRLLIVMPYYKPAYVYGGPVRSVSTLAEALAALDVEVHVFATNANGAVNFNPNPSYVNIGGVHVHYFNRDLPGNYFYSRDLAMECARTIDKFDLVYVVSAWAFPFLPACRRARRAGVPYVVSPRTAYMKDTWRGKYLKKRLYFELIERRYVASASAVHYTSALEEAESSWLGLTVPSFVVSNPVDIAEFDQPRPRGGLRRRYGIPEDAHVGLYMGRIEPRKGLDFTVKAFAKFLSFHPNSFLVLAGPDEDRHTQELQALANMLGVSHSIIFTGLLDRDERLDAYGDADVFLLSSRSENFGMSVVEAMACRLPVLITDRVGVADLVRRFDAGLVTSLDVDQIGAAWTRLAADVRLRKYMGANGYRLAKREFAPSAVAQKMLRAFSWAINLSG